MPGGRCLRKGLSSPAQATGLYPSHASICLWKGHFPPSTSPFSLPIRNGWRPKGSGQGSVSCDLTIKLEKQEHSGWGGGVEYLRVLMEM